MLRVNTLSLKTLGARKLGQITGLVIVVAGAADKKITAVVAGLAALQITSTNNPLLLFGAPLYLLGLDTEADLFLNAILARSITDITTNGLTVSQGSDVSNALS